ncbi:MAG: DUF4256 domain-containing protein [Ignavibacteriaceae bacterium]|nr:DUF4256 domain-containing protein [Ignavibacteriaceae bacterium]
MISKMKLPKPRTEELLNILKTRFEDNMQRHQDIQWSNVESKLLKQNNKLWSLNEIEKTGGEPDVVGYDKGTNEYIFYDCSEEILNCYSR